MYNNKNPDTFRILDVEQTGKNGIAVTVISGDLVNAGQLVDRCAVYACGGAHVVEIVGRKTTPMETLQTFSQIKNVEPVLDSCDSRLTSKFCDAEKVRTATSIIQSMIGQGQER